jgi:hypothetical protein
MRALIAAGIAAVMMLSTAQAQAPAPSPSAQIQCGEHGQMAQVLNRKYGETRQSIGLTSKGMVLEMFANVVEGSWTALLTAPGGPSCIVAFGSGYERDGVAS